MHAAPRMDWIQSDFNWDLAAVPLQREKFSAITHHARPRVVEKLFTLARMGPAKAMRYQKFDGLAKQFLPPIAEQLLDMRVDQRDHAVFVDHEHAVRSRFDDQAHLLFGKFLFAIIHIHGARADNLTRVVRHRVAAQQHGNGPAVANEKLALTGNDFALHRVSIAVCAE